MVVLVAVNVLCVILYIAAPFLYEKWWKKSVLNKDAEFFKVSAVQRCYFSIGFWYSMLIPLCFLFLASEKIGTSIQTGAKDVWTRVISLIIIEFIMIVILRMISWTAYRSIPLAGSLNRKEMVASIECERFKMLAPKVWESEHWIRISHMFFPKNAIVWDDLRGGARSYNRPSLYIKCINGKEYCPMSYTIVKEPQTANVCEHLSEYYPLGKAIDVLGYEKRLSVLRDLDGAFLEEYLKTHSTIEFIKDDCFDQEVINEISKRR